MEAVGFTAALLSLGELGFKINGLVGKIRLAPQKVRYAAKAAERFSAFIDQLRSDFEATESPCLRDILPEDATKDVKRLVEDADAEVSTLHDLLRPVLPELQDSKLKQKGRAVRGFLKDEEIRDGVSRLEGLHQALTAWYQRQMLLLTVAQVGRPSFVAFGHISLILL